MKTKLLLFGSFLFLLSGCTKDQPEDQYPGSHPNEYYNISQDLYPYLFAAGSYWIYKDSATNNLDSIALLSATEGELISKTGPGYSGYLIYTQLYNLNYFSSDTDSVFDDVLIGSQIRRNSPWGACLLGNGIQVTLDSVLVEGVLHKHVIKVKEDLNQDMLIDHNFFFVGGVGIIRKETVVNDSITDVKNLLRYKTSLMKP
jgi:hypothetical protein